MHHLAQARARLTPSGEGIGGTRRRGGAGESGEEIAKAWRRRPGAAQRGLDCAELAAAGSADPGLSATGVVKVSLATTSPGWLANRAVRLVEALSATAPQSFVLRLTSRCRQ